MDNDSEKQDKGHAGDSVEKSENTSSNSKDGYSPFKLAVDENRIGKVKFSGNAAKRFPDDMQAIQSQMLIYKAEYNYPDEFEYVAISPFFEPMPRGTIAPYYDALVTESIDDDGNRTIGISFEKQ